MLDRGGDHHAAGFGRARQLGDRLLEIEEETGGEPAHLVETAFRPLGLDRPLAGLPERARRPPTTLSAEHQAGGDRHPVAPREEPGAVDQLALAGPHRLGRQVAAEVVGQLGGAGVARFGRLAQRLHDDRVEVAGQLAGQLRRRQAGSRRLGVRRRRAGSPPGSRCRDRLRLAAGEQLVEHRAQGVDVGGGGDAVRR